MSEDLRQLHRSLSRSWLAVCVTLAAISIAACLPDTAATRSISIPPIPTFSSPLTVTQSIPIFTYRVINAYPHDRSAFTQGLAFDDQGILYESTGLNDQSSVRRVDLTSGQVLQHYQLPAEFFGEGLTLRGDEIIQLTWLSHVGFVYDQTNFQLLKTFTYSTEGWGLTNDGQSLVMSDGTATLHFLDPASLQEVRQVTVHDRTGPVLLLNELEYVRGEIFANIWQTDRIARIDPRSGQVLAWIDLSGLLNQLDRAQPIDVLNGIAYDPQHDRLLVTGKLWPQIFEIVLIPQN